MAPWPRFTSGIYTSPYYHISTYQIHQWNLFKPDTILDIMMCIKEVKLNTRQFTNPAYRHMYLNSNLEHPPSLKKLIIYSQFIRLIIIHSELQHWLETYIHIYFYSLWRAYTQSKILQAWEQSSRVPREQLLTLKNISTNAGTPIMLVTTYNRANP